MSLGDNEAIEVAVKVLETKPAVINFNYQEISNQLDFVLAKYKGLTFDESTVTGCKKTIAELRKGQKALDEFRKTTKKQLTESVTIFENQCKTLYKKFDDVIQPLTEQQEKFELDRREQKRIEIQSIIDTLVAEQNLTEKYASRLIIVDEYFNKGKTIKAIKLELSVLANTLKVEQDKEKQDIDLVKTKIELANTQYQLSNVLMPDPYLRLLSYKSVAEIELLIASDAQQVYDREKKAVEVIVPAAVEPQSPVAVGFPEPVKAIEQVPTSAPETAPVTSELITAVYEITGTDEQLSALETYLDANNLSWIDRPNE